LQQKPAIERDREIVELGDSLTLVQQIKTSVEAAKGVDTVADVQQQKRSIVQV